MQNGAGGNEATTGDVRHQRMCRGDHELDFGMMLEAKLVQTDSSFNTAALKVYVRDVARTGAAQRIGIAHRFALVSLSDFI